MGRNTPRKSVLTWTLRTVEERGERGTKRDKKKFKYVRWIDRTTIRHGVGHVRSVCHLRSSSLVCVVQTLNRTSPTVPDRLVTNGLIWKIKLDITSGPTLRLKNTGFRWHLMFDGMFDPSPPDTNRLCVSTPSWNWKVTTVIADSTSCHHWTGSFFVLRIHHPFFSF